VKVFWTVMFVMEDGRDGFVDERECGVVEDMCIKLEEVVASRRDGETIVQP
jgi:hypothetical protein